MVPVPLRAWPGVLTLDNHGTGKVQPKCRSDLDLPQLSLVQELKKQPKSERSVTHTVFTELLQPVVLFVITDNGLSKKEGGMVLATWL